MAKKSIIYSAMILSIASILSRIIGIFLRIPLANIVGDYGMGLYQLPYPIYTAILTISYTGISNSLSKLISELYANKQIKDIKIIFKFSLKMIIILSLFMSICYFLGIKYIIRIFKWPSDSYLPSISLIPAIILVSISSVFRGFYNGIKEIQITALSQVIESFIRVITGLLLCIFLIKYNLSLAVSGALLGFSFGALFSLFYLIFVLSKINYSSNLFNRSYKHFYDEQMYLKILFKNIFLFSITSLLISAISLEDSFLFSYFMYMINVNKQGISEMFGMFTGKVMTIIHIPLTFSVAMSISIIPYISEMYNIEKESIKKMVSNAYRYIFIICLPAFMGMMFFNNEVFNLVFYKNTSGYNLLSISACLSILIGLMQITTSILQSINKFKIAIKNIIIGIFIKAICMYLFIVIYQMNIIGCIIANLICYMVIWGLNQCEISELKLFNLKHTGFIYILISSVIMVIVGIVIKYYIFTLSLHTYLKSIIIIISCIITYLIFSIVFGQLNLKKLLIIYNGVKK